MPIFSNASSRAIVSLNARLINALVASPVRSICAFTFAALALQNGVDIKTVSGMLGHYSAGFTLDTYTHVTTLAQTKAAETMGGLLANAVR